IKDNVQHNTYANIGKSNITVLSLYANWNVTPKTRAYVNSSFSYSDFDNKAAGLHNSGWSANAFIGLQHTFPLKIRASMNVGGLTPSIRLQGRSSSYNYYNLSINRVFLKEDRLSIGVSASNFLKKRITQKSVTEGVNFRYIGESTYPRYSVGFNISYRLGNLKASVKKASRTIVNDDVKSGESSSSSSTSGGN
ncbi:MAG: outer membrane beta-barrel family protein, partial [Prevotellaceae bacterium]|nr:outer membrane beta-barrel family protein [Prevotellaceae bacterium]